MTPDFYQYATWSLLAILLLFPFIGKRLIIWPYLYRLAIRLRLRGIGWDASKVEHIYTDHAGNKWYKIINIGDMAWARAMDGQIACKEADFCMTREYMLEAGQRMVDAMNSNPVQLTTVFNEVTEMTTRMTYAAERETLTRLACVYFYLEGENLKVSDVRMNEKKRRIWKYDKEAQAFFLQSAYNIIANSDSTYNTDIVMYLEEAESRANRVIKQSQKVHSPS